MEQLPKEEFKKGNFVVKWNESKFSQVRPVHNLEWLNGIRKRGGGIVGITKTPLALSRWALSYNLRSQIADNTYTMLGSHKEDKFSHNESTPGRKDRDKNDEASSSEDPIRLYNIANKDLSLMKFKSRCLMPKSFVGNK